MHTDTSTQADVVLKDRALFRQTCYIDGAWVTAGSGATITVDDPATGPSPLVSCRGVGAAETRRGH